MSRHILHTYSRATDGPGKILYTTVSHIEKIFRDKLMMIVFQIYQNLKVII